MIKGVNFQQLDPTRYQFGFNNIQPVSNQEPGGVDVVKSFGDFLTQSVSDMNQQSAYVKDLQQKFITGEMPDVHRLMIEAEKSSLNTALTIQIRNKVVEAYQEIMRTQI
jgi:flagellar hook-basal body complex protein FliE